MFSRLRLRLTGLYLLFALALVMLLGGGAYGLVSAYFRSVTDLALQHRMADEFDGLAAPVPPELAAAELAWYARREQRLPLPRLLSDLGRAEPAPGQGASLPGDAEDAYDGELAAIFVLPLGADGRLLFDPNAAPPPMAPDRAAAAAALERGSDWREARLAGGERVRLLTYRLTRPDGPALLQVGRPLADLDRALTELLAGLLALGTVGVTLLGAGSWWLAGRSLQPAQRAWEGQRAFVADASHELRTPLAVIRASAEMALRGVEPGDPRRDLLVDVLSECDHMGRLIGDLLLLSRLDAGQLPVEREVVVLTDLMIDARRQVGRLAVGRGVELSVGMAEGAAWGDRTRLRQALLIALDNAIRHTPAGGHVRLEGRVDGGQARLTVTDDGAGIPPDFLPRVFERFARADHARGEATGGAGLGLAIAKGLVEAQHGEIAIASRLGAGTRVTISLPAATAQPEATASALRQPLER